MTLNEVSILFDVSHAISSGAILWEKHAHDAMGQLEQIWKNCFISSAMWRFDGETAILTNKTENWMREFPQQKRKRILKSTRTSVSHFFFFERKRPLSVLLRKLKSLFTNISRVINERASKSIQWITHLHLQTFHYFIASIEYLFIDVHYSTLLASAQ